MAEGSLADEVNILKYIMGRGARGSAVG